MNREVTVSTDGSTDPDRNERLLPIICAIRAKGIDVFVESMTDNKQKVQIPSRKLSLKRMPASLKLKYSTDKIRSLIDDGDVGLSQLLVSIRIENELAGRIREHFNLSQDDFEKLDLDRQTLGWYVSTANEIGLVEDKYRGTVGKISGKRTNLAHDDGYLETMEGSEPRREAMEELLSDAIDFLEQADDQD